MCNNLHLELSLDLEMNFALSTPTPSPSHPTPQMAPLSDVTDRIQAQITCSWLSETTTRDLGLATGLGYGIPWLCTDRSWPVTCCLSRSAKLHVTGQLRYCASSHVVPFGVTTESKSNVFSRANREISHPEWEISRFGDRR